MAVTQYPGLRRGRIDALYSFDRTIRTSVITDGERLPAALRHSRECDYEFFVPARPVVRALGKRMQRR